MRTASVRKRKSRKAVVPEKVIQAKILAWLKQTGLLHWRQNSGCLFVGRRMITLGVAGLPDIIVVIPPTGKFVGIEVKSSTGKLRPKQEEFRDRLRKEGGSYYVVRSVEETQDAITKEMVFGSNGNTAVIGARGFNHAVYEPFGGGA